MTVNTLDIALLGILQGLLEWIPVSSSGQLSLILVNLLGLNPGAAYGYSIAAHLGTALSGSVFLRREIVDALKLGVWTRITVIPLLTGAPIAYLVMENIPEITGDYFNLLVGVMLIATALILNINTNKTSEKKAEELTLKDLTLVGVAQGLSAIPGLSRSGATIAVLLLLGVKPLDAVKASFAAGIAATLLAALYETIKNTTTASMASLLVLTTTSLIAGIASAGIMISLAAKYNNKIRLFTLIIGVIAALAGIAPLL